MKSQTRLRKRDNESERLTLNKSNLFKLNRQTKRERERVVQGGYQMHESGGAVNRWSSFYSLGGPGELNHPTNTSTSAKWIGTTFLSPPEGSP